MIETWSSDHIRFSEKSSLNSAMLGMAKKPDRDRRPRHRDCLDRPYRETGMEGASSHPVAGSSV